MKSILLVILGLCLFNTVCSAEWQAVPGVPEANLYLVGKDPASTAWFTASAQRLYRSADSGKTWKRVLSLRGEAARFHVLWTDPADNHLYAGTSKGLHQSKDAGKSWKQIFKGVGAGDGSVLSISADPVSPGHIWVGTRSGLVHFSKKELAGRPAAGLPSLSVHSIWADAAHPWILLNTSEGIYRGRDGQRWERVSVASAPEAVEGDELEQFQIEELALPSVPLNIVHLGQTPGFAAGVSRGILQASDQGNDWKILSGNSAFQKGLRHLAASPSGLYAATDKGAFRWQGTNSGFKNISEGLPGGEVRMLIYDVSADELLAATDKGLFRYPHPDYGAPAIAAKKSADPSAEQILGRFKAEPSIAEIQSAAIRYAEVHPSKIEAWRQAAARRAWMPTVSFDRDFSEDLNVDLDRGGTNDPDRFIVGPKEESTDWSVGVSWDLGDLIWNDDQTSIDARSRLMVELRDDVLTEVTHLYFERRRLQTEMYFSPPKEVPLQVEKQLKLDELTAGVDALTGGFLSQRLSQQAVILQTEVSHE